MNRLLDSPDGSSGRDFTAIQDHAQIRINDPYLKPVPARNTLNFESHSSAFVCPRDIRVATLRPTCVFVAELYLSSPSPTSLPPGILCDRKKGTCTQYVSISSHLVIGHKRMYNLFHKTPELQVARLWWRLAIGDQSIARNSELTGGAFPLPPASSRNFAEAICSRLRDGAEEEASRWRRGEDSSTPPLLSSTASSLSAGRHDTR